MTFTLMHVHNLWRPLQDMHLYDCNNCKAIISLHSDRFSYERTIGCDTKARRINNKIITIRCGSNRFVYHSTGPGQTSSLTTRPLRGSGGNLSWTLSNAIQIVAKLSALSAVDRALALRPSCRSSFDLWTQEKIEEKEGIL